MTASHKQDFTPALGKHALTGSYDRMIALLTRERHWRARLFEAIRPEAGETIIDIGSGTGSMAVMLKMAAPGIRMIAVDPDPAIREIAEVKARNAGARIEFVTALGDASLDIIGAGEADKLMISLVLHQCTQSAKTGILDNAFHLLRPGGQLLISDYGRQRGPVMGLLFNLVRMTDGYADTRANKQGRIPAMLTAAGFQNIRETGATLTYTGSISLYTAEKPQ